MTIKSIKNRVIFYTVFGYDLLSILMDSGTLQTSILAVSSRRNAYFYKPAGFGFFHQKHQKCSQQSLQHPVKNWSKSILKSMLNFECVLGANRSRKWLKKELHRNRHFVTEAPETRENSIFSHIHAKNTRENTIFLHIGPYWTPQGVQMPNLSLKYSNRGLHKTPKLEKMQYFLMATFQTYA